MVLPNSLLKKDKQFYYYSSTVSRIDQNIIECFIREGHFERHLNRMRAIYKGKHDIILGELKEWKEFALSGENAGLHLLLREKGGRSEKELIELAKKQGVKVYGLSDYYITDIEKEHKTIVLGYANMEEENIKEGVRRLKEAWK